MADVKRHDRKLGRNPKEDSPQGRPRSQGILIPTLPQLRKTPVAHRRAMTSCLPSASICPDINHGEFHNCVTAYRSADRKQDSLSPQLHNLGKPYRYLMSSKNRRQVEFRNVVLIDTINEGLKRVV